MQRDREHLNVDLGFLDEAKPPEVKAQSASTYKANWRNISIIGGLALVVVIWIASVADAPNRRPAPASSAQPSAYQPSKPVYQPATSDSAGAVSNGQFRCSSYDSRQADLMAPKNGFEINLEETQLKRQTEALDTLKFEIDFGRGNSIFKPGADRSLQPTGFTLQYTTYLT